MSVLKKQKGGEVFIAGIALGTFIYVIIFSSVVLGAIVPEIIAGHFPKTMEKRKQIINIAVICYFSIDTIASDVDASIEPSDLNKNKNYLIDIILIFLQDRTKIQWFSSYPCLDLLINFKDDLKKINSTVETEIPLSDVLSRLRQIILFLKIITPGKQDKYVERHNSYKLIRNILRFAWNGKINKLYELQSKLSDRLEKEKQEIKDEDIVIKIPQLKELERELEKLKSALYEITSRESESVWKIKEIKELIWRQIQVPFTRSDPEKGNVLKMFDDIYSSINKRMVQEGLIITENPRAKRKPGVAAAHLGGSLKLTKKNRSKITKKQQLKKSRSKKRKTIKK